jgi:hypothetical protein
LAVVDAGGVMATIRFTIKRRIAPLFISQMRPLSQMLGWSSRASRRWFEPEWKSWDIYWNMGIYTRLVVKVEVGFGHGMASFSFDEMAWKRAFEEPEVAPGHYDQTRSSSSCTGSCRAIESSLIQSNPIQFNRIQMLVQYRKKSRDDHSNRRMNPIALVPVL